MKITVIGAGSTYTPELVVSFVEYAKSLPIKELCLMDIDPQRLEIVGGFAQRIAEARRAPFRVRLTTDRREAVRGASYVITQLRVGMMKARREDEYLGRRHGLVGQETTGIGGMAKALRTVPVILEIARDIAELAPGALLLNFTNPSGLVAEALFRYSPQVQAVGICNGALSMQMTMLKMLVKGGWIPGPFEQIDPSQVRLDVLGLNHLTWYRGFSYAGVDYWPQVLEWAMTPGSGLGWDASILRELRLIPMGYLQYYYQTSHKLAAQEKWPPSRAEEVMEIEAGLLKQYSDPLHSTPPPELMQRGGAYYSTLAVRVINAHHNNSGEIQVLNVRHGGRVPGWPADWVVELPCQVDRAGIHPLPAQPLPPVCFGLVAQVKMYELLAVEAAVRGDQNAAYQALLAHPLGPEADRVQEVLDDMLQVNQKYLPLFLKDTIR